MRQHVIINFTNHKKRIENKKGYSIERNFIEKLSNHKTIRLDLETFMIHTS